MPIAHGLLTATFLILVAVSAAVVVSMVVLALFDLALGKKTLPVVAEKTESDELEPPSKREVEAVESKPKPKPLAAFGHAYRAKEPAAPKSRYDTQTQRVRHP
ncbi:hypothetical protein [Methyloceanibacter sp.]|uniref:hypothetical protein n=1 Tax=Methyloceanibacter sp. TaxID=1965321 RepID=UPI003D6D0996